MKQSQYIEELYNHNMWISDAQRQMLYRLQEKRNLSDEDLQTLVEQNAGAAKRKFAKVFSRMKNKTAYYNVPTVIFPAGRDSEIVVSCKYRFQRLAGQYKVIISSFYNFDYSVSEPYAPFSAVIEPQENTLRIPFRFEKEDMYIVNIFYLLDGEELLLLSTKVYAVDQDLYECGCYKADLHLHTTYSDGYEPPELVAVSAREHGMDIIAVTDHNEFSGSVAAREKADEMGLNMTVILGEEYSLEYSPMHILALGTKEAIDRKYLTRQVLDMAETKQIMEGKKDLSCCPEVYACTQVLLGEVAKMGGISILAHPYWKPISPDGTRMDTPENVFTELGKDRRFAGIEIVSGSPEGEFNVSNRQASLARTILGTFDGIPVIGITDSHYYSTDPISGEHFTVVFAKSRSREHVLEAIRSGFTVAVELVKGVPLCFGNHRLVKFAEFLVEQYFPARDQQARREAAAAKQAFLLS